MIELRKLKFRKATSHLVLLSCGMVGDLQGNRPKNKKGTRKAEWDVASIDRSALNIYSDFKVCDKQQFLLCYSG